MPSTRHSGGTLLAFECLLPLRGRCQRYVGQVCSGSQGFPLCWPGPTGTEQTSYHRFQQFYIWHPGLTHLLLIYEPASEPPPPSSLSVCRSPVFGKNKRVHRPDLGNNRNSCIIIMYNVYVYVRLCYQWRSVDRVTALSRESGPGQWQGAFWGSIKPYPEVAITSEKMPRSGWFFANFSLYLSGTFPEIFVIRAFLKRKLQAIGQQDVTRTCWIL